MAKRSLLPKFKIPKFRFPFSNPVNIRKVARATTTKKRWHWSWKKFWIFTLYAFGAFILILVFLFAWFAKDLPTPAKIKQITEAGSTQLYDRNGNQLYTISGDQERIIVDDSQIPDNVKEATVALEDKTFYTNVGVDPRGIIRSIVTDILSGSKAEGGSTITQQYVRLAILDDTQKSWERKIKEVILAVEVDTIYSKEQILTMYLNTIPYGGNIYGIEAASESFYGKPANQLTLSEAATLAALPQAPTTLSPYGPNTDALLARRNDALNAMVSLNYITKAQATTAEQDPLGVVPESNSIIAPHFVEYVQQWLVDYFTQQYGNAQQAEQEVATGGLKVTTTLDLTMQQTAQKAVSDNVSTTLKRAGADDASLVTIDPKTGEVLAMVGSTDYNNPVYGSFNAATAGHPTGSSFKPIVYATGFKGKYNPASVLYDLKTDFGGGYTPGNYNGTFSGPVTIRYALGNSLNVPAVKMAALAGVNNVVQTAQDFGITSLNNAASTYGVSLALGDASISPLEMAQAYGVFADNGTLVPTTPILKIVDSNGKTLYDHTTTQSQTGKQVLDPQIAYEISNVLSDVNAKKPEFTNVLSWLTLPGRPAASKTGTTDDYRDAWTIGYTPDYVTSVWVGNNDNTPMTNYSIGAVAAAPIWEEAMANYEKGKPVSNFVQPKGIQTLTVDKLSNQLPTAASAGDLITDIFASWQVPTTTDSVHQQVRVCTENGLLADSTIPDNLTTTKTFDSVNSEMPDNPSWQQPVLAWAAAHGLNNPPPTQKCTLDQTSQPTISITSPSNGSTVSGNFTISANASAPSGVASVEFFVDNVSIGQVTSAPYQISYNAANLAAGSHTIMATVTSVNGATNSDQVTVSTQTNSSPPPNVTSFNGSAQGGGKVALNWTNPTDSNMADVSISVFNGTTGTLITTVQVPSPQQSTTISGLSPGATKFVAKVVDSDGNQSSGTTINLTVF